MVESACSPLLRAFENTADSGRLEEDRAGERRFGARAAALAAVRQASSVEGLDARRSIEVSGAHLLAGTPRQSIEGYDARRLAGWSA
jgi:hypothetical protein